MNKSTKIVLKFFASFGVFTQIFDTEYLCFMLSAYRRYMDSAYYHFLQCPENFTLLSKLGIHARNNFIRIADPIKILFIACNASLHYSWLNYWKSISNMAILQTLYRTLITETDNHIWLKFLPKKTGVAFVEMYAEIMNKICISLENYTNLSFSNKKALQHFQINSKQSTQDISVWLRNAAKHHIKQMNKTLNSNKIEFGQEKLNQVLFDIDQNLKTTENIRKRFKRTIIKNLTK